MSDSSQLVALVSGRQGQLHKQLVVIAAHRQRRNRALWASARWPRPWRRAPGSHDARGRNVVQAHPVQSHARKPCVYQLGPPELVMPKGI